MFRKLFFCFLLFFCVVPSIVFASDGALVKVGGKFYDSLSEAILNVSANETIMLLSDVELEDSLIIDKVVNLNLNDNDIVAPSMVFLVQGGTLNLSGAGIIRENQPNYGAVMIKGSGNSDDSKYSVLNVSKDVNLEGWSGIFINHNNSKAYGIEVNFSGKIKAVNDTGGGTGIGIYVNGNINDDNNAPVVNILDGASITSSGNGLYIAGYSVFNVGKAYISGIESGIGIKSGVLNIDGATVECLGEDNTPTLGYNNGMKASGTTIQIESNNGYAGDMEIDINSGNFKSKDSNVIYEYIGKGNNSLVKSINISGGNFNGGKNVFEVTDSFRQKHGSFITGGNYSSDPSSYLVNGYKAVNDNGMFNVVKSTMKEVLLFSGNDKTNESSGIVIFSFLVTIGIIILILINRKRILNLLSRS